MHNSESERIRDVVILWHMLFGKEWISGNVVEREKMTWEKLKLMADTLGEHKYLDYQTESGLKSHARLNNKALKLIGAVEHDDKD